MPSTSKKGKKDSARSRIVDTATKLFYQQGIRCTGVDKIIDAAGVAKMTFYKHFPSKQALVVKFLEKSSGEWFDWFRQRLARRSADPGRQLEAVFDVMEEWYSTKDFRGCPIINTVVETGSGAAETGPFSVACKRSVVSFLEERARQAGMREPKKIAEKLLLLMEGATVRALFENSHLPARTAKSMAADVLQSNKK